MTGRLRLGVAYPQNELGGDPDALRRYGLAVEALGYDHLLMYDHPVNAVSGVERAIPLPDRGYRAADPFHDPLVAFAHLAALTTRIEFITGILILPQRQTALVARQAADVALLSGGRLRLGVGIGYNPVEYEALGADFRTRGRRLEEQIPYLRQLWMGEPLTFEGEFDTMIAAAVHPGPVEPIPIWIGGFSEAAFHRAARLGDGFVFGYGFGEEALSGWRRVQALLRESDRAVEGFRALFNLLPEADGVRSADNIIEALARLRDAGATDVSISTGRHGFQSLEEHLDFLATVKPRADAALS